MNHLRTAPATLILIVSNIVFFGFIYFQIGTTDEPEWTAGLLDIGALFNPLALNDQWYRIFTHMFMHGGILHLIVNMYGLYSIGTEMEGYVGTKKFVLVYFITGIGAALATLAISIFSIGVGASGAIFGVFGFSLMVNITRSRENNIPLGPLFINFAVFLIINILIARAVHADNIAHAGGLLTGIIIGLYPFFTKTSYNKVRPEVILLPLFIMVFLFLPRFQVQYYNFFQKLFDVEERINQQATEKHTDQEFLEIYRSNYAAWDTTLHLLDSIPYFPTSLEEDTALVSDYVRLAKKENAFRIIMLEKESFIYLDSIQDVHQQMKLLARPEHIPFRKPAIRPPQLQPPDKGEPVKVLYDSNWIEIPNPPAVYYRIGYKDSLGNWDGPLTDYYNKGDVQMKGAYEQGKRDGVFIYYSDHKTYTSAGRYRENMNFGKWESFHNNGRLASEVYYRNQYFLKSLWDSTGIQLVKDGNGTEIYSYPSGVISLKGNYINGRKEGYWYGRYENGKLYFEENFFNGRLVNGRSYGANGDVFYYDESSYFPIPDGGFINLKKYLTEVTARENSNKEGIVRLSFRVTTAGQLADIQIEKSTIPEMNETAKDILRKGPRWIPGKIHGQTAAEEYGFVDMTFSPQKEVLRN
jgi:membrane associated rhomboid family serine protease/antitoxin component YwqK of YwqJK toxin-antitoxin module